VQFKVQLTTAPFFFGAALLDSGFLDDIRGECRGDPRVSKLALHASICNTTGTKVIQLSKRDHAHWAMFYDDYTIDGNDFAEKRILVGQKRELCNIRRFGVPLKVPSEVADGPPKTAAKIGGTAAEGVKVDEGKLVTWSEANAGEPIGTAFLVGELDREFREEVGVSLAEIEVVSARVGDLAGRAMDVETRTTRSGAPHRQVYASVTLVLEDDAKLDDLAETMNQKIEDFNESWRQLFVALGAELRVLEKLWVTRDEFLTILDELNASSEAVSWFSKLGELTDKIKAIEIDELDLIGKTLVDGKPGTFPTTEDEAWGHAVSQAVKALVVMDDEILAVTVAGLPSGATSAPTPSPRAAAAPPAAGASAPSHAGGAAGASASAGFSRESASIGLDPARGLEHDAAAVSDIAGGTSTGEPEQRLEARAATLVTFRDATNRFFAAAAGAIVPGEVERIKSLVCMEGGEDWLLSCVKDKQLWLPRLTADELRSIVLCDAGHAHNLEFIEGELTGFEEFPGEMLEVFLNDRTFSSPEASGGLPGAATDPFSDFSIPVVGLMGLTSLRTALGVTTGPTSDGTREPHHTTALFHALLQLEVGKLVLFHGTDSGSARSISADGIDVWKCKADGEFGQAFYLTDHFRFAADRGRPAAKQTNTEPCVLVYAMDPTGEVVTELETADWGVFVAACAGRSFRALSDHPKCLDIARTAGVIAGSRCGNSSAVKVSGGETPPVIARGSQWAITCRSTDWWNAKPICAIHMGTVCGLHKDVDELTARLGVGVRVTLEHLQDDDCVGKDNSLSKFLRGIRVPRSSGAAAASGSEKSPCRTGGAAGPVVPEMDTRPAAAAGPVVPEMDTRPAAAAGRVVPEMDTRPAAAAGRVVPEMDTRPAAAAARSSGKQKAMDERRRGAEARRKARESAGNRR